MSPNSDNSDTGTVALVGIPFDENVSFMRGPGLAPGCIRRVMHNGSANLFSESGMDLAQRMVDLGDLKLPPGEEGYLQIENEMLQLLAGGKRVPALGGDHSITYPIVKAHAQYYKHLTILHFDAHPDLYDCFEGNVYSHVCPFSRIMEASLVDRLLQVGIRTINSEQRDQADRFGVATIEMKNWKDSSALNLTGPVYLSFDMDVLDPAFAPGVSHHEPGGFSTREVLQIIEGINVPAVGADVVELNPKRDPLDITAMAAVKILKEICAGMPASNSAA